MKRTLALAVSVSALALPLHAQQRHGAQQLDEAFTRAVLANDVEAIVALYAPDAVLYPPGAMEQRGLQAIRAGFTDFLGSYRITGFRIVDARYVTARDLSTGWGRFVLDAVPKAGGEPVRWEGRASSVARRIRGKWLYVADHASMPAGPPPPQVPSSVSVPGRR